MFTIPAVSRPNRIPLVLALVAGAVTSSCLGGLVGQSGPTAPERLDATLGAKERDVIGRWGTPDDVYDFTDGGRAVTWQHEEWNSLNETYFECEITLEIGPDGVISSWEAYYVDGHAQPCHAIMNGVS